MTKPTFPLSFEQLEIFIAFFSLILAIVMPFYSQTPFVFALSSIIIIFFGIQILGSITIYLYENVSTAFYPILICYVCAAIAGTWIFTGVFLGLLTTEMILFLAGQSILAISQLIPDVLDLEKPDIRVFVVFAFTAILASIEILIAEWYTGKSILYLGSVSLLGITTLYFARSVDDWAKGLDEQGRYRYKDVEENLILFTLTILFLYLLG